MAVLGLGQQVRGLLLDVGQSLLLHLEVAVVVTTVTKLERFSREESSQGRTGIASRGGARNRNTPGPPPRKTAVPLGG